MTRSEALCVALIAAVMAGFARGYHPTSPEGTLYLRTCFIGLAGWALYRSVRPGRLSGPWRWVIGIPGVAALAGALGTMVGTSWLVLQMRLPDLAIGLISAQVLAGLGALLWGWRRPRVRRGVAHCLGLLLTVNALAYIPLGAWIWRPPSAEVCAGVEATRLTPQSYPDALSIPYEVRYVPEEKKVLATFKMAGNTVLDFWDDPSANRLVVIDVSDPARPALGDLPLPGPTLPEHTDYNPARREVVLNRVGYDVNTLDFIPLADFPTLSLRHRRDLDYAPQGVVVFPDHAQIGVFSVDLNFEVVDPITGQPSEQQRIPYGGPTVMVTNLSRAHGDDEVAVSTFGQMVKMLNLTTGEVRQGRVPFGGGDIVHVPEMKRIFQTNMVTRGLNVLDTRTMRLERAVSLPYQPRAITADHDRDLLMIGAWFDGDVHFYRLSTLEPLGEPVHVGPYLRKISHDDARGLLYAGSSCGVYQVPTPPRAKRR